MPTSMSGKRDKRIDSARKIAAAGGASLDPEVLLKRASKDDLEQYSPEMLALTAAHAQSEIAKWDGGKPRVSIETLPGVEPGGNSVSAIAITESNVPFLFDSIMGEVTSTHRDIHLAVHPILVAAPGQPMTLFDPDEESDPAHRVSHIQIHLSELTPAEATALKARIDEVLEQVHQAVQDWPEMTALLDQAMREMEAHDAGRRKAEQDEALAFLRWLRDNNFTFLGMREFTYSGKGDKARVERGKGKGLGILSNPDVRVLRQGKDSVLTTPEILAFLDGPEFLLVTKANVKSVVHRRAYMDYIGVKRFDADGNVTGELRVVGLFTSTAYTRQAADIPLLRDKLAKVIDHFGYDPQSHSGKMLANTLESYPRDDLFQIDSGLLARFSEQINDLGDRPRVRVLARADQFDRFVSVIVFVPREQYNSDVRERIGEYLKTVYDGRVSAYYPAFPEGGLARVHFIIGRSGGKTPRIPQAKHEAAVRSIVTRWEDRFDLLARKDGVELDTSTAFQSVFPPSEAYADLPDIVAVRPEDPIRIAFYHLPREVERPGSVELKIFHAGSPVSLSRRVPVLENLGFRVISEQTHDLTVREDGQPPRPVVLHDMELVTRDGRPIELDKIGARLEEAFLGVWNGVIEDGTFNRLIVLAGLTAREVNVLRAYARYLRQAGITYSQDYISDTLNKYPAIAADLFRLFKARMDPTLAERTRDRKCQTLMAAIEDALASVPSLDDDRILRRYANVIQSTLRTNYFQQDAAGNPPPVLAFKLDPQALEGLPEPRPYREIFVYGTQVEGVHLRFGPIARGGLRWSDRAQDYRTEVLGLVKAQQVKNAVIVPVGAKGGFYPKQLPEGGSRDEIFNAGKDAYKTFIRTLLSVTDNIVGPDIVPPPDTLRIDGDDPYFVVAADKGTATFSDTANGLAQEAGFWLDDAFASGGSAGYDHKKMGITARGAWEAVKRHFREMDIDIQTTPFTVAGVGDMSGDVFGNGMLLSEQIRLIAAFDHRDIFIDPDPDTAKSFAERKRMFDLPRSSWQDYDRKAMSPGGMIISRAEKLVTLTPEAQAAIGLDKAQATPFEIMTAILKAPVDLLWFGGIGTYLRGSLETDAEVGDRANDPIRITATEAGARVIGEGANLGVTQKGRIEFGLNGGRCNSDAIDNSAGVNSSDVEVNIKIALAPAMHEGRLPRPKRNKLLASMTDQVADLVLRNNYQQTLALSLTEMRGAANRTLLGRLMTRLEEQGHLNRKVETLPNDQLLGERYQVGKPLTRAEIGVLLSYAKLVLFDELVASDLPDDPYFVATLENYFPAKMRKAYAGDIHDHRLRREIIATVLANEAINRGGPDFVATLTDATGHIAADVVKAAVVALEGLGLPRVYAEIDALDNKIPGALQNRLYQEVGRAFAQVTERLLRTGLTDAPVADAVARLRDGMTKLRSRLRAALPPHVADEIQTEITEFVEGGVPATLTGELADLMLTPLVPEIMEISAETGIALDRTAQAYFAVTEALRIDRLLMAAERIQTTEQFEAMALSRGLSQISNAQRALTAALLRGQKGGRGAASSSWQDSDTRIASAGAQLELLVEKGEPNVARITVAAGLLEDLAKLYAAAS
ncbi:NAD-glutamate dehydrogenase [Paracoccus xiamenensis]|uniref:NAD-glutamate dehydrogenase n=1 Tax=Paracoccus xiamenensis TaxID=2714901 RepID=UPI0014098962|nr:NAD-glutamate dehydrogenase [Paracoccus xiamenensis]NHF73167.1 NAD-glutamate dehydrogenase [Paracoccus xiamenensis]